MQHPHDDETIGVAGGELLVLVVPNAKHHSAIVAFECLVHSEIAWCCHALGAFGFGCSRDEFENLNVKERLVLVGATKKER